MSTFHGRRQRRRPAKPFWRYSGLSYRMCSPESGLCSQMSPYLSPMAKHLPSTRWIPAPAFPRPVPMVVETVARGRSPLRKFRVRWLLPGHPWSLYPAALTWFCGRNDYASRTTTGSFALALTCPTSSHFRPLPPSLERPSMSPTLPCPSATPLLWFPGPTWTHTLWRRTSAGEGPATAGGPGTSRREQDLRSLCSSRPSVPQRHPCSSTTGPCRLFGHLQIRRARASRSSRFPAP
mmetsp:Transcript_27906/g.81704  ORF Transcript_27906/g.81704 Transcript_27906/m.81704 type:complete len:236 (+) Transcript_27906:1587-2294(+)